MKPWFKAISHQDPVGRYLIRQAGWEALAKFNAVLEVCQELDDFLLDEGMIQDITHSNIRGARKFIDLFQECMDLVANRFKKVLPKLPKLSESSGKFPKLEGQNPRGRNKSTKELDPYGELEGESHAPPRPPVLKKSVVSENWLPGDTFHAWLKKTYPDVTMAEFEIQLERFKIYCQAHNAAYANHEAALRGWFINPIREREKLQAKTKPINYGMAIGDHNMLGSPGNEPVYQSVKGIPRR